MNTSLIREGKRNVLIATSIVGGVTPKECELVATYIQDILYLNNFSNFRFFPLTLNSKLPKYYQELNTLPFLLYSYSMKNATKSTKAFFYELPQYMRSPIDEYYLIIIANSELEFDDRISNLKKLHPNLLSFIIQVGPVQTEYQNSLLKFGFEGRFYLKKYSELRGILHYIRKTFSQTGKGISEMIDYINKFSLEHNEAHQKPLKIITLEKPELISKHLGIVFVVDSGLEFLGNFISKILEESAVRWELLSLTELKKIDFDCDHILIFFNSSAVLDPKKPPLIDLLVAKFSNKLKIAYFEAPNSSINENGYKVSDDRIASIMVFYEKKRFVQTYPLVDELNLPMTEEEVSVVTDFIKACL